MEVVQKNVVVTLPYMTMVQLHDIETERSQPHEFQIWQDTERSLLSSGSSTFAYCSIIA